MFEADFHWQQFFRSFKLVNWLALGLTSLGFISILSASYLLYFFQSHQGQVGVETSLSPANQDSSSLIAVDIGGAITKPGIYRVPNSARLSEVIDQASGFTNTADQAYVAKTLNLASKVTDGQKIYIPFAGELAATVLSTPGSNDPSQLESNSEVISINTASQSQLEELPGIGEKRAADIIAGRPYGSIEDLVDREILTSTLFESLKNFVAL